MGWMCKLICKVAVVCEQKQTFAVLVKTAHRINACRCVFDKVKHCFSAAVITGSCDISARFVEHIVVIFFFAVKNNLLTVNCKDICLDIHFVTKLNRAAVEFYSAFLDNLFCLSAGAKALVCHCFLNSCISHYCLRYIFMSIVFTVLFLLL